MNKAEERGKQPVYPVTEVSQNQATGETIVYGYAPNLTIREHFAISILAGMMANPSIDVKEAVYNGSIPVPIDRLVTNSVAIADKLLKELSK